MLRIFLIAILCLSSAVLARKILAEKSISAEIFLTTDAGNPVGVVEAGWQKKIAEMGFSRENFSAGTAGLSCSNSQEVTSFKGTAMTIDYQITVGALLPKKERKDVEKRIQTVFEEVNALYNKWNPESEISRLNRLKAGEKVSVSQNFCSFFKNVSIWFI